MGSKETARSEKFNGNVAIHAAAPLGVKRRSLGHGRVLGRALARAKAG